MYIHIYMCIYVFIHINKYTCASWFVLCNAFNRICHVPSYMHAYNIYMFPLWSGNFVCLTERKCVRVYVCVYVYVSAWLWAKESVHVCVCVCVYMCIYARVCCNLGILSSCLKHVVDLAGVRLQVQQKQQYCSHVFCCTCAYVCVLMYIYVYIYTYTFIYI